MCVRRWGLITHSDADSSTWVRRFMPLIPREGRVLDVACGVGRHALALIEAGYVVYGVDNNPQAILTLENRLATHKTNGLQTSQGQNSCEVLDLELAEFPSQLQREQFSGVIITNYLYRPFWQIGYNYFNIREFLFMKHLQMVTPSLASPRSQIFIKRKRVTRFSS